MKNSVDLLGELIFQVGKYLQLPDASQLDPSVVLAHLLVVGSIVAGVTLLTHSAPASSRKIGALNAKSLFAYQIADLPVSIMYDYRKG